MPCLSRRGFLACAAALAPGLLACSGDSVSNAAPPEGVEILPGFVQIRMDLVPSLTKVGGSLVVPEAHVIVIRAAESDYRAFSNICTHAGCGIYEFTHPRIRCQCHGSEFDLVGMNIAGPALLPLPRLNAVLSEAGVLSVALP
ncbi:MAG: Rieske (2Fe-2S) protein [Phycisphaerae bacterium]|nr:Rieske (2Fe-2S) protein [Gemmatimonadaceae bacterium]